MPAPRAGDCLRGRYTLDRKIGAGGMGAVWKARDETLGRSVAVKMIANDLADDEDALIRFEREAKAVANLRSPHIVEIHDYGVDAGCAFMVMEMLEGVDLAKRLREETVLPLDAVAVIVAQIARALTTAHQAGILHRDLKPANIFLLRDQDHEIVKVFDFGVAKFVKRTRSRKLTEEGVVVGTPRYMSPEHLQGDESDARDDVWGLSVIAYRCICGVPPFNARGMVKLVQQIVIDRPPPPSTHLATLSPAVDELFSKALAADRGERFQKPRELADALLDVAGVSLSGSGIVAHPRPHEKLAPEESVTQRIGEDALPTDGAVVTTTAPVRARWRRSRALLAVGLVGLATAIWALSSGGDAAGDDSGEPAAQAIPAAPEASASPSTSAMLRGASSAASAAASASSDASKAAAADRKTKPKPRSRPPKPRRGDEMFDSVY